MINVFSLNGKKLNRNKEIILRDHRHKERTQPTVGRENSIDVDSVINHYH